MKAIKSAHDIEHNGLTYRVLFLYDTKKVRVLRHVDGIAVYRFSVGIEDGANGVDDAMSYVTQALVAQPDNEVTEFVDSCES